jgi:prepilin-type N-terminal cleavage/methylation domain-containing protein
MKKLDNRGFTLVELLAVLVILISIMSITVPAVSDSLESNKKRQEENNEMLLESSSEFYVTNNKKKVFEKMGDASCCYIELSVLVSSNYLDRTAIVGFSVDENGEALEDPGVVAFYKNTYDFSYKKKSEIENECVSCVG